MRKIIFLKLLLLFGKPFLLGFVGAGAEEPSGYLQVIRGSSFFPCLLPTNLYFEGSLQEILCFLQFFQFISVHIALLFPLIGSKSLG